MDYKQKYGKLLVTEDQQRRFREIVAKYDDNSAGHEAIDFKFQDVNGKQVALSDFKGKVVYVDVWATWCASSASCRALPPRFAMKSASLRRMVPAPARAARMPTHRGRLPIRRPQHGGVGVS